MDELFDLLREVSSGVQLRLQELPSLRELNLAPFSARLLVTVGRRSGCSQQDLACWTGRDKAQIARTIKELEARGLLVRSKSASDWRAHDLCLTDEGASAYRVILNGRADLASEVTLAITPHERRIMIAALEKIRSGLDRRALVSG